MKNKLRTAVTVVLILLVLFVPIPTGTYKDGGTQAYTALTYKVVSWRRAAGEHTVFNYTSVYLFPDNFKSIDELWEIELEKHRDAIFQ